jgi:hypothetical protein
LSYSLQRPYATHESHEDNLKQYNYAATFNRISVIEKIVAQQKPRKMD